MFYGQILRAPSPPLRVPILFDLSVGLTGPREARGCPLLWSGVFIHLLVFGERDASRTLSAIHIKGLIPTACAFVPGERPRQDSELELHRSHVLCSVSSLNHSLFVRYYATSPNVSESCVQMVGNQMSSGRLQLRPPPQDVRLLGRVASKPRPGGS